jgi:hypothetical protein
VPVFLCLVVNDQVYVVAIEDTKFSRFITLVSLLRLQFGFTIRIHDNKSKTREENKPGRNAKLNRLPIVDKVDYV